ncbi:hypothetical protein STCU_12347 [Strigomonas culicis]|uniref:RNase H type-1 domain-containing protein n=1 Tax=Strigomonas culicis TaxID=28005 RepID=S9TDU8_9TRYP|nr:hypothetical protein STCU_12347 [Strigomonas culicis]|eukprot:EPY15099.1 hypothetical protein STCU_12347 [Strigomonas culicis]
MQSRTGRVKELPLATIVERLPRVRFITELVDADGWRIVKSRSLPGEKTAFNLRQLSLSGTTVLRDLWTDGSLKGTAESGGAFLLTAPHGVRVGQGMLSLGAGACSYSVERAAMRMGLAALELEMQTLPEADAAVVRLITDSLSVLEELRRGPFAQCEEECDDIWASLLLLRCREVHLVFVFSHEGGATFNQEVDALAKRALSAVPSQATWPQDHLRHRIQALRDEYDVVTPSSEEGAVSWDLVWTFFVSDSLLMNTGSSCSCVAARVCAGVGFAWPRLLHAV